MRSAAIYVGPDFVGDRWQHFRRQLRLNVVNLEYLTIYICGVVSMDTDHVITARCLIGRSINRDTSHRHTRT